MGFWHVYFGLYGGGGEVVSPAEAIEWYSTGVYIVNRDKVIAY